MVSNNLPIMLQSNEQQVYLTHIVQENEFNAFCVDCQNNRSTHCNVTYGTYICGDCSVEHMKQYPLISYIKPLDEVWDPHQLKVTEQGGNKNFYEFMREYQKERTGIAVKYKTDAATWYRKKVQMAARGMPFEERQPPRNAQEAAQRAADDAKVAASAGMDKAKAGWNDLDQKYKIAETTSANYNKAKSSVMGWFSKKDAAQAEAPKEWKHA